MSIAILTFRKLAFFLLTLPKERLIVKFFIKLLSMEQKSFLI